jgi:hypothetical protein
MWENKKIARETEQPEPKSKMCSVFPKLRIIMIAIRYDKRKIPKLRILKFVLISVDF